MLERNNNKEIMEMPVNVLRQGHDDLTKMYTFLLI